VLKHCEYDTIKLIHELSSLLWFIEQHAKHDAENADHDECYEVFHEISQSLENHIEKLKECL
jgi:hypothetical protein